MYVKTNWEDYLTFIDAEKFNKIEEQIALLSDSLSPYIYRTNENKIDLASGSQVLLDKFNIEAKTDTMCNLNLMINSDFNSNMCQIKIMILESPSGMKEHCSDNILVGYSEAYSTFNIVDASLPLKKSNNTVAIIADLTKNTNKLKSFSIEPEEYTLVIDNIEGSLAINNNSTDTSFNPANFEYNANACTINDDTISTINNCSIAASKIESMGDGYYTEFETAGKLNVFKQDSITISLQ